MTHAWRSFVNCRALWPPNPPLTPALPGALISSCPLLTLEPFSSEELCYPWRHGTSATSGSPSSFPKWCPLSSITSIKLKNMFIIFSHFYQFLESLSNAVWTHSPSPTTSLRSVIFNHPTLCSPHPHQVQLYHLYALGCVAFTGGWSTHQGQHSKRTITLLSKQLTTANIPTFFGRDGTLWPPLHAGMKKDT